MSDSLWPHGLYSPWNFPGQNTGVGSHSLLQGILPTQGLNPGLLHCGLILYHLSHHGSPFCYRLQINSVSLISNKAKHLQSILAKNLKASVNSLIPNSSFKMTGNERICLYSGQQKICIEIKIEMSWPSISSLSKKYWLRKYKSAYDESTTLEQQ